MGTIFLYFSLFTITLGSTLPNFVVFLADDLGYGDLGCFGNDTISTPNIDQLALSGVKLNHHLTAAAVCTPSRAALLTGRYPIRSGMESSNRNKVFFFAGASGGLPEREITIARALKENNYVTSMIGKWHLGNDCINQGDGCHHPINHGFDSFFGLPLSNFKDMGDKGESVITSYVPNFYSYFSLIPILGLTTSVLIFKKHKCWSLFFMVILFVLPLLMIAFLKNLNVINGILMQDLKVVEQPLRLKGLTQRFVEKAKTFLSQQTSSQHPFFLYFSFVHVHTALFCSDDFKGKSKHGPYGDNVEELDWAVGEVMTTLKSSGLLNNTFVYFSSDNGAHIEEVGTDGHREGGSNGILRGGKTMGGFEGGIRVPTIISWPGFPIGEINFTTSQMDLFPTMMELAKIQVPQDRLMDGKSLVPLLQRKSNSPHTILFHYCGRKIHAATYIQNGGKNVWKVHWTTPKFTPGTNQCEYVCHCFGDFVEHHNPPLLFDLLLDPSESHPKKLNSDHFNIILEVERAREEHIAKVEVAPDQFSFENTVWKPWLQPCCNFPICKCTELMH